MLPRKPQSAGCACGRKQSFRTPITENIVARTGVIHNLLMIVGSYCEGVCLTAAKNARGFLSFFLIGGDHEAEQASGSFLAFAPYLTVVHLDHRLGDR